MGQKIVFGGVVGIATHLDLIIPEGISLDGELDVRFSGECQDCTEGVVFLQIIRNGKGFICKGLQFSTTEKGVFDEFKKQELEKSRKAIH